MPKERTIKAKRSIHVETYKWRYESNATEKSPLGWLEEGQGRGDRDRSMRVGKQGRAVREGPCVHNSRVRI